jgi:hypothetical protein
MGGPQIEGTTQSERGTFERDEVRGEFERDELERDRSEAALRAELREVEEDLESVRAQARSLRGPLGGRDDGPMDLADNATQITLAEEQEALIEVLVARRDTLLRRLEAQR